MNTNFYSLWFDPPGIRTQVYRCSSRRSIHSTTDWLKYVSQFTYLHFGGGLSPPSSAKSWFCAKRRSRHLTFPSQYLLSHKKFLLRKLLMTSVHVICGLFSITNHKLFIQQTRNRRAEKKRRALTKISLVLLRRFLRSCVFD